MLYELLKISYRFGCFYDEVVPIQDKILARRQIQVLVALSNHISQDSALTSLIIAAIGGVSGGLAMIIRIPWTSEQIFLIFIFVCCITNGFMIIGVCLSGMVVVYRESKNLKHKVMRNTCGQFETSRRDGKLRKCFWRSVPLTKIKFGASNYVDELTPLNTLNFSMGLAVQFLLLTG